jgi:hypothetical protein
LAQVPETACVAGSMLPRLLPVTAVLLLIVLVVLTLVPLVA